MNLKRWQFAELVERTPGRFDVVTPMLHNPVDRLARAAMRCPDESFAGLPLSEAIQQANKFERWRELNESRKRKKLRLDRAKINATKLLHDVRPGCNLWASVNIQHTKTT